MSCAAFATPTPVVLAKFGARTASVCLQRRFAVTATLKGYKRVFSNNLNVEDKSVAPAREGEYRGPQGWTPYAEKVNGRLAQFGFVIGLVTEIVSGKPISEQILLMFSPLVAAANGLAVLGAQAAHLGPGIGVL